MAKKSKGGRRRRKISIFAAAGIVTGLWQLYKSVVGQSNPAAHAMIALTGYNPLAGTFNWKLATAGIPMIAGAGASMIIAKTGLNRYVNIPWFKL